MTFEELFAEKRAIHDQNSVLEAQKHALEAEYEKERDKISEQQNALYEKEWAIARKITEKTVEVVLAKLGRKAA